MAFADADDVEQALRRELSEAEAEYVDSVIAEASDLIIGYLGCDPTDATATPPVPEAVTRVTARMVARVYQQDDGRGIGTSQTQDTAGPFMQGRSFVAGSTTGSPWLAGTDKIILRPYRCGGGMRSVAFKSERGFPDCDEDEDS